MSFQYAHWPLPANVLCGWSTRQSGYSVGALAANNLARHVGTDSAVEANRALLASRLAERPAIHWLNQTHSTQVVDTHGIDRRVGQDGATTIDTGQACCVMTADCLPVFLWSLSGHRVAVIHAGWRGLAQGILINALRFFDREPSIYAGIGPAISQANFEVGQDVREAFATWPGAEQCFQPGVTKQKYQCDLPGLAAHQLRQAGVADVYFSDQCTFQDQKRFYSYRRDGVTGRMANLIWKTT
ncbi:peptidoglycan editing factor PgeF [Reinekea blandensis]|uniref:Purine nucleoside phosphorylase n=1 Tax=Reinekea blandensis MED297 TaxID=314283 RepID=A4BJJ6_9GAMM|nr:peptidoglycan editing factor PgeF [Reinekea blandensis]EAR07700.1 hypothetical protein MED297_18166 [Reinekea sp. MED297] [Reinekea blandensis MED297]